MASMMQAIVDIGIATYTLPGQQDTGDRQVVIKMPDRVLVAVIDGLGHGQEAAMASERAVATIKQHAHNESSLPVLVQHCHAALNGSRGVVMNLAIFNPANQTLAWLGIGDVEGRLLIKTSQSTYSEEALLIRSGVVGHRLPRLRTSVARIGNGDTLIFATDGVLPDFAEKLRIESEVNDIANHIVEHHRKNTDDALVLVARYVANGNSSTHA
jgi:phosphoserine phosphatase RsbX